jgi:hypothetical protein
MKVNSNVRPVKFHGEGGETLTVRPSNMGEPYRDGMDFTVEDGDDYFGAFLTASEIKRLHAKLGEYLNNEAKS